MRFHRICCILLSLILFVPTVALPEARAAGTSSLSFDLNNLGKTITNKFSEAVDYDLNWWKDDSVIPNSVMPADYFATQFPYVKYVQLIAATGGSVERDLFVNPNDRSNLTDYKFDNLINAAANLVRQGLKPYMKTGSVPLKLSAHPHIGVTGTNDQPPSDYDAYYNYIKAMANALVDQFGLSEVRTWKWGVMQEFNNAEWFDAGDPTSTKTAYLKLYDYTVAGLEDALGPENVQVGAHSISGNGAGYWDEKDLLDHLKSGTNYKRGTIGTQLDFISISYYDVTPVGFDSARFLNSLTPLRNYANSIGYTNLEYGMDEGHILTGWDNRPLASRSVQHPIEGSSDAKIFKFAVDNDLDWFEFWDYTQVAGVDDVKSVSGNVRDLVYRMSGDRLASLAKSGSSANPADEVDGMAGLNSAANTAHVLVFNNNADGNATTTETVTHSLRNIAPVSGSTVTVKKWILDESHGNWWGRWWLDQSNRGLTDSSYFWSKYSANLPWNLLNASDRNFWLENNGIYKNQGELFSTTQEVTVSGNRLDFVDDISHHGVVFYEITNVQSVPEAGQTAPGAATSPTPSNGAIGVSATPSISWTAGSGAASHDVYFGTSNPPPFVKNQSGTTYTPDTLAGNTTYYWRIDERSSGGTAIGTVRSFTTSLYSAELLSNPGFESGTTGWNAFGSATLTGVTTPIHGGSQAVKVTSRTDEYGGPRRDIKSILLANGKGNYEVSSWLKSVSGSMSGIMQIWVKYDGGQQAWFSNAFTSFNNWTNLSDTLGVTWTGNLEDAQLRIYTNTGQTGDFYADDISLTRKAPLTAPGTAGVYAPANGATDVSLAPTVSWTAGLGTASHDVYFGTSNPPPFVRNQSGTAYRPGPLSGNTTYYWRIDEKNNSGTTAGTVKSFTTTTPPAELLGNPGFESGTTGWTSDGAATLTAGTSPVHGGSKAVLVSSRSDEFGGPRQDIKNLLLASGQGDYETSLWLKSASGTMSGIAQIWLQYDGGKQSWYSAGFANFSDWTQLSYTLNVTWTGTLEAAQLRIFTNAGQTGNFYADDISLKKEGKPFPLGPAKSPSPANGATGVSISTDLSWSPFGWASSHDVYFGTTNPPPLIRDQKSTSFNPGTLSPTRRTTGESARKARRAPR